jgi:hypothetical protein
VPRPTAGARCRRVGCGPWTLPTRERWPPDCDGSHFATASPQGGKRSHTASAITSSTTRSSRGASKVVHRGIYRVTGTPETWRGTLLAACLRSDGPVAAPHRAAAALWHLEGFEADIVEITVTGNLSHHPPVRLDRVRRPDRVDVATVDEIPTTTPARTLLDLASVAPIDAVELALEDALRRRLVSLPRVRWTLSRLGGPRPPRQRDAESAARGAAAAPLCRDPQRARGARGPPHRAHQPPASVTSVRRHDHGRALARVDFAWPDVRLGVEADGFRFHTGRADWQRERRSQKDSRCWAGRRSALGGTT